MWDSQPGAGASRTMDNVRDLAGSSALHWRPQSPSRAQPQLPWPGDPVGVRNELTMWERPLTATGAPCP